MAATTRFSLNLVLLSLAAASLVVLGAQADEKQAPIWQRWMDGIQSYMERDLEPCGGVTVALDIMGVASKRAPSADCRRACEAHEEPQRRSFEEGDYKYSGSSVLCCCGRPK